MGQRVNIWVAALLAPPLLRLRPLPKLVRSPPLTNAQREPAIERSVAGYLDSVLYRLPGIWKRTCLKRSLVLYHLMRSRGLDVRIVVGVRRISANEPLQAHSWLTLDEQIFLEPVANDPSSYRVIGVFPDPGAKP